MLDTRRLHVSATRSLLFAATLVATSFIAPAHAQEEFAVPESTEAWSDAVWDAAIRGDAEQLEAMLAMVPADALSEQAISIRAQVEAFKLHAAQAATDRSVDREDAHKRMVELMGEENSFAH